VWPFIFEPAHVSADVAACSTYLCLQLCSVKWQQICSCGTRTFIHVHLEAWSPSRFVVWFQREERTLACALFDCLCVGLSLMAGFPRVATLSQGVLQSCQLAAWRLQWQGWRVLVLCVPLVSTCVPMCKLHPSLYAGCHSAAITLNVVRNAEPGQRSVRVVAACVCG
jgi:hypothetical protein